jgi:hypothetical protein
MGLKQGAIGNTHGEHIGNLLEQKKNEKKIPFSPPPPLPPKTLKKTHGEHIGNLLEQRENEKIFLFPPPPPLKT